MSVSDEIFRVTGLGVQDGKAAHFSKTATESVQDAELRFLKAAGATSDQINDAWIEAFGPGQINDVKLAYWEGQ